ncbi:MAG TPA: amidohydrolase family protein [Herpetosiphonaceae bacterium]
MLTLIHGGEVYTPDPIGVQSLLIAGDTILKIGEVDPQTVRALGVPCLTVDATGCVVAPGLIDPHEHLIGAGGEEGFGSRLPEVALEELLRAGITTVVGCLGTDMTTRHLTSLLAKVQQLEVQGLSAYMYTGGYALPPNTLTGTVTNDLVLVASVIGVGEFAIADPRCSEPTPHDLARLVSQGMAGGMLSGKAGITHFHLGPGKKRLSLLTTLIEDHEVPVESLYPTHINRSEALMDEAIDLARRGAFVDLDTVDDDLAQWLSYYREHDGLLDRLTVSSDAHTKDGSPAKLRRNLLGLIREHGWTLAEVLPLCTRNPAAVLKLKRKGQLQPGMDADIQILRRDSLDLMHLFARGQQLLKDGQLVAHDAEADPES